MPYRPNEPPQRYALRLASFLLRHRYAVTSCAVVVAILMAWWSLQLDGRSHWRASFPIDHPYIQNQDRFAATFGGTHSLTIMLEVKDGTIFTPDTLNRIWRMTQSLDAIEGVYRGQIESIAHRTVRYLKIAAGGTMRAVPLMQGEVKSADEAEQIRAAVHSFENIHGALVSLDDKAALIRAYFVGNRPDERRITEAVRVSVVQPNRAAGSEIFVAGETQLYGSLDAPALDAPRRAVLLALAVSAIVWLLCWWQLGSWRMALVPVLSSWLSTLWGLGWMQRLDLGVGPLMLLVPAGLVARALSHAVQRQQRLCVELAQPRADVRSAVLKSYDALFGTTVKGLCAEICGLAILAALPGIALQKLAIAGVGWLVGIALVELLLSPLLNYYLAAASGVSETGDGWARRLLSRKGRRVTMVAWLLVALGSLYLSNPLQRTDAPDESALVPAQSEYLRAQRRIQEKFGGIYPLLVVAEGADRDAIRDPLSLRHMEDLQRDLERDPNVGGSVSLADITRSVNAVAHEMEPKWGMIPNTWAAVGELFFLFFSGTPASESAKYVDAAYSSAPITFFCSDLQPRNLRRIVRRCEQAIFEMQLHDLGIGLREPADGAVVDAVLMPRSWVFEDNTWMSGAGASTAANGPFAAGDQIVKFARRQITDRDSLRRAMNDVPPTSGPVEITLQRHGTMRTERMVLPWKTRFTVGGGIVAALAAADQELPRSLTWIAVMVFGAMWLALSIGYRSAIAGLYLIAPPLLSAIAMVAGLAANGNGIGIHTLPLLGVMLGFGVSHAVYLLDRIIGESRTAGHRDTALQRGWATTGRAAGCAALAALAVCLASCSAEIPFSCEMAWVFGLGFVLSTLGVQTLLPVLVAIHPPRFLGPPIASRPSSA